MRIAIATTQSPFVKGGAEYLARNLLKACQQEDHDADLITHPFLDQTPDTIKQSIDLWSDDNFSLWGNKQPDAVIGLKFPAFYIQHPCTIMWTLHQHRAAYDLWDYAEERGQQHTADEIALRQYIFGLDKVAFNAALQNFTISKTVSKRLKHYNNIDSTPVYHPPALADVLLNSQADCTPGGFIFAPSRFEPLKRQHLLLEALLLTKHPVKAVLCGQGSFEHHLRNFVIHHNLSERVIIYNQLSDSDMALYYKNSLAVFFAPYDEDYGYVTLEAMLAKKAVITCCDSGGTTEFVEHGHTGYIEPPDPKHLAARLDELYVNKQATQAMGRAAADAYQQLGLSWRNVLEQLLY